MLLYRCNNCGALYTEPPKENHCECDGRSFSVEDAWGARLYPLTSGSGLEILDGAELVRTPEGYMILRGVRW